MGAYLDSTQRLRAEVGISTLIFLGTQSTLWSICHGCFIDSLVVKQGIHANEIALAVRVEPHQEGASIEFEILGSRAFHSVIFNMAVGVFGRRELQ